MQTKLGLVIRGDFAPGFGPVVRLSSVPGGFVHLRSGCRFSLFELAGARLIVGVTDDGGGDKKQDRFRGVSLVVAAEDIAQSGYITEEGHFGEGLVDNILV